jgi:peroxiredoxin
MKASRILFIAAIATLPALLLAQPKAKAKPKMVAKVKTIAKEQSVDTTSEPFQLIVGAKGFRDSMMAVIVHPANQQYQGPFGYVKAEKVVLKGSLPQTDAYVLVMTDGKNQVNDRYYNLYLGNQHSQIEVSPEDKTAKVIKGELLKTFDGLIKTFGPYFDELTRINQQKQMLQPNQSADSLNNRFAMVTAQVNQQLPVFITNNANSTVATYLLYTTRPIMSLDQLQRNLNLLQGEAAADDRVAEMRDFIKTEKATGQGQPAPDFVQNDTLGNPVSLSSFKGKYVLVDFWASWCGPCRQENPNVVNAYTQYKDKNFTVLGVSLDREKSKWMQAIHADRLTWTHVSDLQYWQNAVAQQYKIQSIPQNFLIGPDGKIIAKNLRGGVLHAYLKDLLK